jgi:hypothetical protein
MQGVESVGRSEWLLICYLVVVLTHQEQDPYLEHVAAFMIPPGQDAADEQARALQPPDPAPPSIVEPDTHVVFRDFPASIEWTPPIVS